MELFCYFGIIIFSVGEMVVGGVAFGDAPNHFICYNSNYMRFLGLFCFCSLLLIGVSAQAYEVISHETKAPYDIFNIEAPAPIQQFFIGSLQDFPEMYEINSENSFLLNIEIRALPNKNNEKLDFNLIIVRQKDRGVEEVARLSSLETPWPEKRDRTTGLSYLAGKFFNQELPAGIYHLEVSTPDNLGKYILVIGNQPQSVSYFTSLKSVNAMYLFYNTPRIFMLRSPIVYYPLGILTLLGLIIFTWRWQQKQNLYA